jgi:hypothetical protein
VAVADHGGKLGGEVADDLVQPLDVAGQRGAAQRRAQARDQQHAHVLGVVTETAPVDVDEVHPVATGIVDHVVGVEVAVHPHQRLGGERGLPRPEVVEQVGERPVDDAEDAGRRAAHGGQAGVRREQLGQAVTDLRNRARRGRAGGERGQPHVAQRHAVQELSEKGFTPALVVTRLDVGEEAGHHPVPDLDLAQLLVDLALGALLPQERTPVDVYVGDKTRSGELIERAGLTNGSLYGLRLAVGNRQVAESSDPFGLGDATTGYVGQGRFSLANLGDVSALSALQLEKASINAGVTRLQRCEDGAWDPAAGAATTSTS